MPFLDSFPENAGPPYLFKKYPHIYLPWSEASEAMMNGDSPLSRGERELILSYAAGVAGCEVVNIAHAEVAYVLGIAEGLVAQLLTDFDAADITPKLRALLRYVKKLATNPSSVCQGDVDSVMAAGWSEHALHDAIAVTARASFMQRLVQGHGFEVLPIEVLREHAVKRVQEGYVNLYSQFRDPEIKP